MENFLINLEMSRQDILLTETTGGDYGHPILNVVQGLRVTAKRVVQANGQPDGIISHRNARQLMDM